MTSAPPSPRSAAVAEIGPLARLAAPLVSGLVLTTGVTLVDTAMLGPLGAVPLAAVSLAQSVIIIFYAALYGFAGPIGLFVGRAFGAGETTEIGRVTLHGAVLGVLGGLAGAVAMALLLLVMPHLGQPPEVIAVIGPYWLALSAMLVPFTVAVSLKSVLDSTDRAWTGVALSMVPVALNVALNWVLIYGHLGFPALGLTGAGIASLVATTVGAGVLWLYVRHAPSLRTAWDRPVLTAAGFREIWDQGRPMAIQYLLEGGSVAVVGILIGYFGAIALAGNQIALAVGSTLYMLPLGIAAAVSIRVAQMAGADERQRIVAVTHAGLGIVTVWMGLFALGFLVAGEAIAALFVADAAVIAAAAGIFFVFGLGQLLDGVQSVSLGALRGLLDNEWPTRVSLVAYWAIGIPLGWVIGFPLGFGAAGVWTGFSLGLAVAATALFLRFRAKTRDGV